MSKEKYAKVIQNDSYIDNTYFEPLFEAYLRLAYINCVQCDQDIEDIDKIFNFLIVNGSFFGDLTENKQLREWVHYHLFYLGNDTPTLDFPEKINLDCFHDVFTQDFETTFDQLDHFEKLDLLEKSTHQLSSNIERIAGDLNMSIISDTCIHCVRQIQDIAKSVGLKAVYYSALDFQQYIERFDDMDAVIELFHVLDIQVYKFLEFVKQI